MTTSPHADVDTTEHYDHEFAGFSVPLTFEATSPLEGSPLYRNALAPGTYVVKMVIQDVSGPLLPNDPFIDSAAFIPADSLTLFELQQGDYNGDGVVDAADYAVWSDNYGKSPPVTFYDGDGNGDCVVNSIDYNVWHDSLGATGNADLSADFNRDGAVDAIDYVIWHDHYYLNITHCASRFEGDADGDGAVTAADYYYWIEQYTGSGGSALTAVEEGAFDEATLVDVMGALARRETNKLKTAASVVSGVLTKEMVPKNPDLNGDGAFDDEDKAKLDAIILGGQE